MSLNEIPNRADSITSTQPVICFIIQIKKASTKVFFGENLAKVTSRTWKEHIKEQRIHGNHKLYESDINPVFRCLEENYLGKDSPKLNVAFFDIETDMQPFAVSSQHMVKIRKKSK